MTTTKDEALKRAFEARQDEFGVWRIDAFAVRDVANAAFLSSLRESGWTLAPVEATDKMIEAALLVAAMESGEPLETFSLKQINAVKTRAQELYSAMLAAHITAATQTGDSFEPTA